jgi:hypothetical protein
MFTPRVLTKSAARRAPFARQLAQSEAKGNNLLIAKRLLQAGRAPASGLGNRRIREVFTV